MAGINRARSPFLRRDESHQILALARRRYGRGYCVSASSARVARSARAGGDCLGSRCDFASDSNRASTPVVRGHKNQADQILVGSQAPQARGAIMTVHRVWAWNATNASLCAVLLCTSFGLGSCAGGDFGRVKSNLVSDDIHSWLGTTAALGNDVPISSFPLTDDERTLRDLAYPLIEPPYDRQRWYGVLNEYGVGRIFRQDWSRFDAQAYTRALTGETLRSEAARYARLGNDIRNDRVRVPPFFLLASRVLEMDRRRELNLDAVSNLTP